MEIVWVFQKSSENTTLISQAAGSHFCGRQGSRRAGDKIKREGELSYVYLLLEINGSIALDHMPLSSETDLRKGRN